MIETKDIMYLRQAMALAQHGEGSVNPNPLVGAVVVRDDVVIAQGYHHRYGELHAEREAFADADGRGVDCSGATMYVTLEPCCHHGKQPPCTEAIMAHRIGRVVVGLADPNPLVAGKGLGILQQAGISVELLPTDHPLAAELREQNRVFLHYITTRRPWVVMKYAMTLDGKICTRTGDSRWISGEASRLIVHRLRKALKGIVVGIGTVLADDPMLTTRLPDEPEARNPIRIVLDRQLRIPLDSRLVQSAHTVPTIVAHHCTTKPEVISQLQERGVTTWLCPTLPDVLRMAGEAGIDGLLLEGGGTVNEAFVRERLINEVYAFVAPMVVGGADAKTPVEGLGAERLSQALRLRPDSCRVETCGDDVVIHGLV